MTTVTSAILESIFSLTGCLYLRSENRSWDVFGHEARLRVCQRCVPRICSLAMTRLHWHDSLQRQGKRDNTLTRLISGSSISRHSVSMMCASWRAVLYHQGKHDIRYVQFHLLDVTFFNNSGQIFGNHDFVWIIILCIRTNKLQPSVNMLISSLLRRHSWYLTSLTSHSCLQGKSVLRLAWFLAV